MPMPENLLTNHDSGRRIRGVPFPHTPHPIPLTFYCPALCALRLLLGSYSIAHFLNLISDIGNLLSDIICPALFRMPLTATAYRIPHTPYHSPFLILSSPDEKRNISLQGLKTLDVIY
jgi:hypothetical protein